MMHFITTHTRCLFKATIKEFLAMERFHLTMHCYLCSLLSEMKLIEHEDARWLSKEELESVKWLPADMDVIQKLKERN